MADLKVSFKLNTTEMFRKMGNTKFMRAGRRWGYKTGANLEHKAKTNVQRIGAPSGISYRRGRLAPSISHRVIEEATNIIVRVGSNVEYAPFVEFGTGLHGPKKRAYSIYPTKKKALAWNIGAIKRRGAMGDVVVKKVVFHPGMVGKRYLAKALVAERRTAEKRLASEVKAEMEKA